MPSVRHNRTIEVQDRDVQILRGLFESRVMTVEHLAAIHFEGRYEAARKRVQKLKAAGYVGERPRRAYDPAVLFLTRKAFAILCERGAITDFPPLTWANLEKRVRVSPLTLRHELEVQDVKAALHRAAAETNGLHLAEFNTWPRTFQFRAFTPEGGAVINKPDGMIRIVQTDDGASFEHTFFLEVDRSTETLETLAQRACCYRDFYRRGGLAVRHGRPAAEFEKFPFRVLMVFKNAERRNNTAEKMLACRPPILTQVWLTTFAEATNTPLGPIWLRPADYRDAMSGSGFPSLRDQQPRYRRSAEREDVVETRVRRQALLTPPAASTESQPSKSGAPR